MSKVLDNSKVKSFLPALVWDTCKKCGKRTAIFRETGICHDCSGKSKTKSKKK